MMLYRYVNENRIMPCPKNGTAGGKHISNLLRYLEKHPETARAEGYKQLIEDAEPQYDTETQYITFNYEDTQEAILKHFYVNETENGEEEL